MPPIKTTINDAVEAACGTDHRAGDRSQLACAAELSVSRALEYDERQQTQQTCEALFAASVSLLSVRSVVSRLVVLCD